MPDEIKQQLSECISRDDGSLLELADRSDEGRLLLAEIRETATRLLAVPSDFTLLLIPGGGTQQFAMAAYSLRGIAKAVHFVETDHWSCRAKEEMAQFLSVASAFDGKQHRYSVLPVDADLPLPNDAAVFFTTNNTASGTQWPVFPSFTTGGLRIADMSSDLFGRPPEYDKIDIVLACAQKNFGVAGLSFALVRNEVLERMVDCRGYLSYRSWLDSDSLYSTFPVVAAAVTRACLRYIDRLGVDVVRKRIAYCSTNLYRFLDQSTVFRASIDRPYRSRHNVTFQLTTEFSHGLGAIAASFKSEGFEGLKGHPSVGGFRASFYVGASEGDADALVKHLSELERALLQ